MAEFVGFGDFKPSFPLTDMDSGLESMNHFPELKATIMENPSLGLMGYSDESFLSQQSHDQYRLPPMTYVDNLPMLLPFHCLDPVLDSLPPAAFVAESKAGKRKMTAESQDRASGSCSVPFSGNGLGEEVKKPRRNSSGKGKRGKCKAKEDEKPKEVVHVRARRGQATDSHSLAERVRREKINERMKCLQDLVPGCYKAMGMAVMLDEIINYVQSLQNQVEFLSMKLSGASSFCDFSLDMDELETPQVGYGYEGQDLDSVVREGYGGGTSFHSSLPF